MLMNRDYTLIIDKSGSMSATDQSEGKSRWEAVQESTLAVARKIEKLDPDGLTVYLFAGRFKRYDNVTSDKVSQIFLENDPMGTTNLTDVLKDAFQSYFQRKAAGETQPEGEIIVVITDGAPNNPANVMRTIVDATQRMERDEELGVTFFQIGSDAGATKFLKALDDELEGVGAKFDICDTVTFEEMENYSILELLMKAIED
ncbi:MAG: VWA domain-containing protein [Merismopedia sp. SIO2A8]|nr:VWA domain-containing protein [Symploca sp. SIO2B6]NET48069.1 VWA domain-containing protein [Merismopedia sp. SIO2A8]